MLKQHKFLHFIVQFVCHIIDNVGCGTVATIFLETRRNDTEFNSSKRCFAIFRESFNNRKLIKDTPEGIDHITRYSTNELNHCISARGDKIDKQRANDKIYVPLTVLETN